MGQEKNLDRYGTQRFDTDTAIVSSLIDKAKSFRHTHNDSGLILYHTAFKKSTEIGFVEGAAKALTGLGLTYMDKGEYRKSLTVYRFAEPYCKAASNTNGRAIVVLYNNMAALYGNRDVTDTAAIYYYKALEQMEVYNVKDTNLLLLIYSNLAGRLTANKQYSQARFYLNKALPVAQKTNNNKMLAKVYTDFGMLYGAENKLDSSRIFSAKALFLFSQLKDPASEIVANCNIGKTFLEERKPQNAIKFYQRALKIKGSKVQKAMIYRGLGACFFQMKNYPEAEHYYLSALAISEEENLTKGIIESNKALVDIYSAMGNSKASLLHRNAYDTLQDSAANARRNELVNDLEIKYRTAEKDKELAEQQLLLQQKESKIRGQNRFIIFITVGSFLILALVATLYRNYKQKKNIELLKFKTERKIAQLKARMQGEEKERERIARELHDGIMVQLSAAQMNLSTLIEKEKNNSGEEIEQILVQLENATKELRKSAHNLMPDMLLKEGLAAAAHYFVKSLERSTNIQTHFQLIGEMPALAPDYELMLYRVIQELLQNIIKHAKAKNVIVQMNCQHDMISLVVEDDGVGFDKNKLEEFEGMGLGSIASRIKSLQGHFSINSAPEKGTSVYIELEIKQLQFSNPV
ncbi:MAG TPA: sensor histidine kinase [Flavipsychrobacter sp.]|nr:sensor histidine kinase [Flavipsychrobacter sp.]